MTVIVAIKSTDGIVMAADRRVTVDDRGWRIPMADKKIGRVGTMLVGTCGDSFPGEVLMEMKPPKRIPGEDALTYLRKRVLPKIRLELNDEESYEWAALVALDGRLFEINHTEVVEIGGGGRFWACGAGKEVAIGYLHARFQRHPVVNAASCSEIARETVEVAAKYNTTCGDGCDIEYAP